MQGLFNPISASCGCFKVLCHISLACSGLSVCGNVPCSSHSERLGRSLLWTETRGVRLCGIRESRSRVGVLGALQAVSRVTLSVAHLVYLRNSHEGVVKLATGSGLVSAISGSAGGS